MKENKNKTKKVMKNAMIVGATAAIVATPIALVVNQQNNSIQSDVATTNAYTSQSQVDPNQVSILYDRDDIKSNPIYQKASAVHAQPYALERDVESFNWLNPMDEWINKNINSYEEENQSAEDGVASWQYGNASATIKSLKNIGVNLVNLPKLNKPESKLDILSNPNATFDPSVSRTAVDLLNRPSSVDANDGDLIIHLSDFNPNDFNVSLTNISDHPNATIGVWEDNIRISGYSNSKNGLILEIKAKNGKIAISNDAKDEDFIKSNLSLKIVARPTIVNGKDFEDARKITFKIDQPKDGKLTLASKEEIEQLIIDKQQSNFGRLYTAQVPSNWADMDDNLNTETPWNSNTSNDTKYIDNRSIEYLGFSNDYSYYLFTIGNNYDNNVRYHKIFRLKQTNSELGINYMTGSDHKEFVKLDDVKISVTHIPGESYIKLEEFSWSDHDLKIIMSSSFEFLQSNIDYLDNRFIQNGDFPPGSSSWSTDPYNALYFIQYRLNEFLNFKRQGVTQKDVYENLLESLITTFNFDGNTVSINRNLLTSYPYDFVNTVDQDSNSYDYYTYDMNSQYEIAFLFENMNRLISRFQNAMSYWTEAYSDFRDWREELLHKHFENYVHDQNLWYLFGTRETFTSDLFAYGWDLLDMFRPSGQDGTQHYEVSDIDRLELSVQDYKSYIDRLSYNLYANSINLIDKDNQVRALYDDLKELLLETIAFL